MCSQGARLYATARRLSYAMIPPLSMRIWGVGQPDRQCPIARYIKIQVVREWS
jgi:hypothetical protein